MNVSSTNNSPTCLKLIPTDMDDHTNHTMKLHLIHTLSSTLQTRMGLEGLKLKNKKWLEKLCMKCSSR